MNLLRIIIKGILLKLNGHSTGKGKFPKTYSIIRASSSGFAIPIVPERMTAKIWHRRSRFSYGRLAIITIPIRNFPPGCTGLLLTWQFPFTGTKERPFLPCRLMKAVTCNPGH
jgi:hypothetical protein